MFKKIIILTLLVFLTSCGSDENPETTNAQPQASIETHTQENFSINIPSSWEVIGQKDDVLPNPNQGTIEMAAVSKKETAGFFNNILILSDELKTFTTSKDFSLLSNVGASSDYIEYEKIEAKQIQFTDGEESLMYVFEAKYNINTPKVKFIQTARICNAKTGYLLTIAIPTSITKTSQYEVLLQTFTCNIEAGE